MKIELPFLKAIALMACLLCAFSTMAQEAYAEYYNDQLTFYYDDLRDTRIGITYDLNNGNYDYDLPGWDDLQEYDDEWGGSYSLVRKVVFDPSFAAARPTTTFCWFCNMRELQSITGIEYLNTSQVINMGEMFSGCKNLTSLDLSSFDTGNVTNMVDMFGDCGGLKSLDLSGFNTANVTNMDAMFYYCSGLTSIDLSGFDTGNVTSMSFMFYNCSSLTSLDLSGFNTVNVTNMGSMFNSCSSLTSLDLSGFNTVNVTDMGSMFKGCCNLSTIYTGNDWNTDRVTQSYAMFYRCTNLVGGMGTTYDSSNTDKTYAHIDGGPENPGYFTAAQTALLGDVDGDGRLGITDVTDLIDLLLNGGEMPSAADVDGDGTFGITDVTALIDLLLSRDN